jgi:hypothetical protein
LVDHNQAILWAFGSLGYFSWMPQPLPCTTCKLIQRVLTRHAHVLINEITDNSICKHANKNTLLVRKEASYRWHRPCIIRKNHMPSLLAEDAWTLFLTSESGAQKCTEGVVHWYYWSSHFRVVHDRLLYYSLTRPHVPSSSPWTLEVTSRCGHGWGLSRPWKHQYHCRTMYPHNGCKKLDRVIHHCKK